MGQYEIVRDLGVGQLGAVAMARDIATNQLVAIRLIERGHMINESVEAGILTHRLLRHPNIIRFKEVILSNLYLGIVMEYAAGGQLHDNLLSAGRLTEDLARCLFQQLISGVSYLHSANVCHWSLKLESTLLDRPLRNGHPAPRLKICDFGISENERVRTPIYLAPEIFTSQAGSTYDKKMVNVWTCGVILYIMLVGSFPFGNELSPELGEKIMNARFSFPNHVPLSMESRDLISRIFVVNPKTRITISEIKCHPWYLHNLPNDIGEGEDVSSSNPLQSAEEIVRLVDDATRRPGRPTVAGIPI